MRRREKRLSMVLPAIVAATAVTLAAASGVVEITPAQIAAEQYGRVLGAAAECRAIDRARIATATQAASAAVRGMVQSAAEFERLRGSFADAAVAGVDKVRTGGESCADAEAALKSLEQQVGH
jgi:hypothetical protein